MKLDGATGSPLPAYNAATQNDTLSTPAIHTDGTIFTVDTSGTGASVIAIDPQTGTPKFTVQLDQSESTGTCTGNDCGSPANYDYISAPTVLTAPMIAGDGYAYVAYEYSVTHSTSQENETGIIIPDIVGGVIVNETSCIVSQSVTEAIDTKTHLFLLRIGNDV